MALRHDDVTLFCFICFSFWCFCSVFRSVCSDLFSSRVSCPLHSPTGARRVQLSDDTNTSPLRGIPMTAAENFANLSYLSHKCYSFVESLCKVNYFIEA